MEQKEQKRITLEPLLRTQDCKTKLMPQAQIDICVELDEKRLTERILWRAEEATDDQTRDAKALHLSCWDEKEQQTMRIELWTKNMSQNEMKRFYIDMLGSMSQSILQSTGDEYISKRLRDLCEDLIARHRKDINDKNRS